MVYSVDMLLEENYNESTSLVTSSNVLNESYFDMALRYVNEMSKDFNTATKTFYKGLLESGNNEEFIHEAFEGFGETVKKIINKFLDFIKKIFAKFSVAIHKLIKSDSYIKDHKKDFYKFTDTFDIKGYKFTRLDDEDFPVCNAYDNFNSIAANKITIIGKENPGVYDSENILKGLTDTYSSMVDNLNTWHDLFRGKVLGKDNHELTKTEFEQELFEIFRDGESSPVTITIGPGEVEQALDRFLNYDKTVKAIENLRKKMESEYKEIKSNMKKLETTGADSIMSAVFNDDYVNHQKEIDSAIKTGDKSTSIQNKIDQISKLRISRIETMCATHSLAFSKKLDAAKSAFKQDRSILYAALKRIVKAKNEAAEFVVEDTNDLDPIICDGILEDYNLTEAYEYEIFMIEQMQNQNDIVNYITECIAIENVDVSAIRSINESAVDTIKELISKICEAVKKMFGKFSSRMAGLVMQDETWLSKYKDVILKKDFKNRSITMYDYSPDRLNAIKVPTFASNVFVDLIGLSDEEFEKQFIEKNKNVLPGLKSDSADTLKEQIINIVRGEEEIETTMPSLNGERLKMFNYCATFKTLLKNLERDNDTIYTNSGTLNGFLAKEIRTLETSNESAVYSNVLESYILEQKIGKEQKDGVDTSGSNGGSKLNNDLKVGNDVAKGTAQQTMDSAKKAAQADFQVQGVNPSDKELNAKTVDKAKEYQEASSRYFKACSSIVAAKITVAQAIYKDYMKILRTHVSDYGGSADKGAGDNDATKSTVPSTTIGINNKVYKLTYHKNLKILKSKKSFFDVFCKNLEKDKVNSAVQKINKTVHDAAVAIKGEEIVASDVFMFNGDYIAYQGNKWINITVDKKLLSK